MSLIIIFCFTVFLLITLGTYIWKKEAIWLLSNFSADSVRDRKGLARFAGIFLYLFALLISAFCYGLLHLRGTAYELIPVFGLIFGSLLLSITYMVIGQRFLHKYSKK